MSEQLHALHFPDWRSGNYFQQNLADVLSLNNMRVSFATYHGAFFPLTKNIRASGADVLHLHWEYPLFGVTQPSWLRMLLLSFLFRLDVLCVKLFLRKRIVWTVHNLFSHDAVFKEADLRARTFLAQQADVLIAMSDTAQQQVVETYTVPREKVKVVLHGNYITNYANSISREEAHKQFNFRNENFTYLFLGALRPYKGLEELLRAFAEVTDANARLIIVGKPFTKAYGDELLFACSKDTRVLAHLRFIKDAEVQQFMNAADVVVFPFRQVFTSGSVILAMSFGKAIISADLGLIRDYVSDEGGIFFKPQQTGALQEALQQIRTRNTQAMGAQNFQRAKELDWKVIGQQIATLYSTESLNNQQLNH